MDFLRARKNFLLLIGSLLLVCILLLIFAFSLLKQPSSPPTSSSNGTSPSQSNQQQFSSPTPYPTSFYSKQYKESVKEINKEEAPLLRQANLITAFEKKLPYQGTHISVYYTQSINQVVLMLDPAHQQEANTEFDTLLGKYHIDSRSWFPNLVTAFIEPTPGP
jgi:hypothetical protein